MTQKEKDLKAFWCGGAQFFVLDGTKPITTYTDEELTTPQTHPLIADCEGNFPAAFVPEGVYSQLYHTKNGHPICVGGYKYHGPGVTDLKPHLFYEKEKP